MPNIILIQNSYPNARSLQYVINYALLYDVGGGYALNPQYACRQMQMVKEIFHKQDGEQLLHFVISFSNREMYRLSDSDIVELGNQIGFLFYNYQMVYGIHYDTDHIHLHVVMNTVSFRDGRRYSDGLGGFWKLRTMLQKRFPKSDVGIYRAFPDQRIGKKGDMLEDELYRIG